MNRPPLAKALLLPALAGGMGWGIRGQYGHETGAMIAGVLIGLTLILVFFSDAPILPAARAAALLTVGISFGGVETYGQTVGLTKDAPFVGDFGALFWGLLGLFIKGGVWIGFAGGLLGMGLGGVRYRAREMLLIGVGLLALFAVGVLLFNRPFDPAHHRIPPIYFSNPDLKPRDEKWGGLLLALAGLAVYAGVFRRDPLAPRLAAVGFVAGGLGFALGACVQATHGWHPEWVRWELLNWWNLMEITFGLIAGAGLGWGVWRGRDRVVWPTEAPVTVPVWVEALLVAAHAWFLWAWTFQSVPWVDWLGDTGIAPGIVPLVGIVGGRFWPWLLLLPLTALPIAGKTMAELSVKHQEVAPTVAWSVYMILPLAVTLIAALRRVPLRIALLLAVGLYFLLNFAFFRWPWPWQIWTGRTPNGILYIVFALTLLLATGYASLRGEPEADNTPREMR